MQIQERATQSPYDLIGGQEHANEKLFMFLSGWLGGPQLYADRFGHPMLRARHLPFAIAPNKFDAVQQ